MWLNTSEFEVKSQMIYDACLPMSGLFDVIGMMDETVFRNMVRDSKIVTPKKDICSEL